MAHLRACRRGYRDERPVPVHPAADSAFQQARHAVAWPAEVQIELRLVHVVEDADDGDAGLPERGKERYAVLEVDHGVVLPPVSPQVTGCSQVDAEAASL